MQHAMGARANASLAFDDRFERRRECAERAGRACDAVPFTPPPSIASSTAAGSAADATRDGAAAAAAAATCGGAEASIDGSRDDDWRATTSSFVCAIRRS